MRVDWVHPSWRDLVIEDLAADADRRRAFIAAGALPGVQLALSTAGGAAGERALPLLVADDDWDALGDTVHRLALELGQQDLTALLALVRVALEAAGDRRRAELVALSEMLLATVRRRVDHERLVIDAALLDRWLDLDGALPGPPVPPPSLDVTLAALEPADPHPRDPESVRRLDDYLAVVQVALRALELPPWDGKFDRFVTAAELIDDLPVAVYSPLRRLGDLVPALQPRVLALLGQAPLPTTLLEPSAPPRRSADARRVRRILLDL